MVQLLGSFGQERISSFSSGLLPFNMKQSQGEEKGLGKTSSNSNSNIGSGGLTQEGAIMLGLQQQQGMMGSGAGGSSGPGAGGLPAMNPAILNQMGLLAANGNGFGPMMNDPNAVKSFLSGNNAAALMGSFQRAAAANGGNKATSGNNGVSSPSHHHFGPQAAMMMSPYGYFAQQQNSNNGKAPHGYSSQQEAANAAALSFLYNGMGGPQGLAQFQQQLAASSSSNNKNVKQEQKGDDRSKKTNNTKTGAGPVASATSKTLKPATSSFTGSFPGQMANLSQHDIFAALAQMQAANQANNNSANTQAYAAAMAAAALKKRKREAGNDNNQQLHSSADDEDSNSDTDNTYHQEQRKKVKGGDKKDASSKKQRSIRRRSSSNACRFSWNLDTHKLFLVAMFQVGLESETRFSELLTYLKVPQFDPVKSDKINYHLQQLRLNPTQTAQMFCQHLQMAQEYALQQQQHLNSKCLVEYHCYPFAQANQNAGSYSFDPNMPDMTLLLAAIFDIGYKHARPKAIMEAMPNIPSGLVRATVKSRLQKYRQNALSSRAQFWKTYQVDVA